MSDFSRRNFLRTTAAAGLALPIAGRPEILSGAPHSGPDRPATPSDDPLGIRDEFPVTRELAYLNTASLGPSSRPAHDAMVAYAEEKMMYRDPGSRPETRARARASFARLFGADEDEIAFLFSTSDAENIITDAINWRPGDNVVVDELHFTTTFVLYREIERRLGVELRVVPVSEGRTTVDDFAARTDVRTRLISVAWVSNRNGYRHTLPDLAEVAHAHGGYLYADAIQAFGNSATDLHEEGVDFACGNGYKWLFADFGCAPFYVRREHLDWLEPDRFGHRQVAESLPDHRFRLRENAQKYEHSNPSFGAVAAMDAALTLIEGVGLARIEDHTVKLAGELRSELVDLGFDLFTPPRNPSPIVSFYHELDPDALYEGLREEGVPITFQEQGRLVRTAVAMFNTRDDIDRLLGVLSGLV
ncbi:MAG: aminotransferase class V-fold PLP-dependent enzyme [Gemmatimonadota bacterium]|nr:aminotransferase class V-fold PLP-dependent enzyme [Gemmatimonadota bacterium]